MTYSTVLHWMVLYLYFPDSSKSNSAPTPAEKDCNDLPAAENGFRQPKPGRRKREIHFVSPSA